MLQQFNTDGRPIPVKVAEMELARAPPTTAVTKSSFPHKYRNQEGKIQKYPLYEPWEHKSPSQLQGEGGHPNTGYSQRTTVNGGYPTGGYLKPTDNRSSTNSANFQLSEFPVSMQPAGRHPFDYDAKPARAKQVERPIHENERKNYAEKPMNDPGRFRANVNPDTGHMVGATYHPQGNRTGFVRATMSPLDRQAGQNLRQHQDMNSRSAIRQRGAAARGEAWDDSHPNARHQRIMTVPGREQGSEELTGAISRFTGGRKSDVGKWVNGVRIVERERTSDAGDTSSTVQANGQSTLQPAGGAFYLSSPPTGEPESYYTPENGQ